MKNVIAIVCIIAMIVACSSAKKSGDNTAMGDSSVENDTIRIANDSLDYEIIIFEPGFNSWLATQQPRGFYNQNYLEQRNWHYVVTYNSRVISYPYSTTGLYPQQIDYQPDIDYGYEVNYLLYHYFLYFQREYNQKL